MYHDYCDFVPSKCFLITPGDEIDTTY